ncbi:MAG: folate family ECF transporter S component [Firmicutes bacterium]|nr:folate family ECF transporter S component [Bacillota bacterium]
MRISIRNVVVSGLLAGMSILLSRLAAIMIAGGTIRLSFGNIPIYMAGLMFGPVTGGLVGGVADLVGMLVNSFGAAFVPHIFLAAVLRGVIPPLVVRFLGENNKVWPLKVFLAILLAEIASGALLTTWGLAWLQKTPFTMVLVPRLIALAVQIPIYSMITVTLTLALRPLQLQRSAGR